MTTADRNRRSAFHGGSKGETFCLHCFALIARDAHRCPACGGSVSEMSERAYGEKLLRALDHPLAEVRMRAIIALGKRSESDTAEALVACALRHPSDVVEGLEIVRSLSRLNAGRPSRAALRQIADIHPASAVKKAASQALTACPVMPK